MSEQQTGQEIPTAVYRRGIFDSGIPASVAFIIGALLFLLPFIEIKCNAQPVDDISGAELATGYRVKATKSDNTLVGKLENSTMLDSGSEQLSIKGNDVNLFALTALLAAVLGFIAMFIKSKTASKMGLLFGIIAAGGLIGLWIQITRQVKEETGSTAMEAGSIVSVTFTPWFYLSLMAFLLAAFSCYLRIIRERGSSKAIPR